MPIEIGDAFAKAMADYRAQREDIRWASPKVGEPCEYCGTGPHVAQCPNCGASKRPFGRKFNSSMLGRSL